VRSIYFNVDSVARFSKLLDRNGLCFITPISWKSVEEAQIYSNQAFDADLISRRLSLGFEVNDDFPKSNRWDEAFFAIKCNSFDDACCVAMEACGGAHFFAAFGESVEFIRDSLASKLFSPMYEPPYLGASHKGHDIIRSVFRHWNGSCREFNGFQIWSMTDLTGQERSVSEYVITGDELSLDRVYRSLAEVGCSFASDINFCGSGEVKFFDLPEWISDWSLVVDRGFDISSV
jgi:hypothetical protein